MVTKGHSWGQIISQIVWLESSADDSHYIKPDTYLSNLRIGMIPEGSVSWCATGYKFPDNFESNTLAKDLSTMFLSERHILPELATISTSRLPPRLGWRTTTWTGFNWASRKGSLLLLGKNQWMFGCWSFNCTRKSRKSILTCLFHPNFLNMRTLNRSCIWMINAHPNRNEDVLSLAQLNHLLFMSIFNH